MQYFVQWPSENWIFGTYRSPDSQLRFGVEGREGSAVQGLGCRVNGLPVIFAGFPFQENRCRMHVSDFMGFSPKEQPFITKSHPQAFTPKLPQSNVRVLF